MEDKVCVFNKYGYCKYAQNCRRKHVDIICEIGNCEEKACERRHPKVCKYFSFYKRCKFGEFCRFKHCEKEPEKDLDTLNGKINILEKTVADHKAVIANLIERLSKLEVSNEIPDSAKNSDDEEVDEVIVVEDVEKNVNRGTIWFCFICENTFENETVYRNHMENHNAIPQIDGNEDSASSTNNGINIPRPPWLV